MSLTPEQIRLREYLQDCVDEVRSKKYIKPLSEELNYLPKRIGEIALTLAQGKRYRNYHNDVFVYITTSDVENKILSKDFFEKTR